MTLTAAAACRYFWLLLRSGAGAADMDRKAIVIDGTDRQTDMKYLLE